MAVGNGAALVILAPVAFTNVSVSVTNNGMLQASGGGQLTIGSLCSVTVASGGSISSPANVAVVVGAPLVCFRA